MTQEKGSAHFRWSGSWVLGPLGCGLILVILWICTLSEIKEKQRQNDQTPSVREARVEEAGPPRAGPKLPEDPGESTSLEEDRRALFAKLDLGAISAAERLWAAGKREEVFIAVEDPLASSNLRLQLLGLLATDGSERAKAAARKVLEMNAVTDEMKALCGLILERGGGEKAHGQ